MSALIPSCFDYKASKKNSDFDAFQRAYNRIAVATGHSPIVERFSSTKDLDALRKAYDSKRASGDVLSGDTAEDGLGVYCRAVGKTPEQVFALFGGWIEVRNIGEFPGMFPAVEVIAGEKVFCMELSSEDTPTQSEIEHSFWRFFRDYRGAVQCSSSKHNVRTRVFWEIEENRSAWNVYFTLSK